MLGEEERVAGAAKYTPKKKEKKESLVCCFACLLVEAAIACYV